jgi:CarD family transcriptional regulator
MNGERPTCGERRSHDENAVQRGSLRPRSPIRPSLGSDRKEALLMTVSFKVGDKAVYPAHGVGEVKGIEKREFGGRRQTFYIFQLLDSNMTIFVPTNNAKGLREVISQDKVSEVFSILKERSISVSPQTWNRRQREYLEKIKSGSVFEIAEVLRDLSLLKFDKELSFGERKLLDLARSLVIKELSIAQNVDEAHVEKQLSKIFEA